MQNRQRLVFRHVDLVQNAEAAIARAEIDRAGTEGHLSVFKGIHADEACRVHIHMEGHIPAGARKDLRQIFREHIFARGLAAGEQQIFSAQNGGDSGLPDLFSVIVIPRSWHAVQQLRRRGIGFSIFFNAVPKLFADLLLL